MSRADDLRRFLSNARHSGEAWQTYRRRRVEANKAVEAQLRGRLSHVSTQTAVVEESKLGEFLPQIAAGKLIRVGTHTSKGKVLVALRTKGVTYRREAA